MTAVTFDTFRFVDRLEKAGASRELAAALVEVQRESLAEAVDVQIATKSDIHDVKSDIQRIDYEIRLLKWMIGLSLALSTGMLTMLARVLVALPD